MHSNSEGLKAAELHLGSPEFKKRHIGPSEAEQKNMLSQLGFGSLEEMASHVIPKSIYNKTSLAENATPSAFASGHAMSEAEWLKYMRQLASRNHVYRTHIGMGFYDCHTPAVIQRNVFEDPVWYTAYTPYQAEIAQGRLEALLNYQTMVADLTGLEVANASLLDEGSAAAEAMAMAHLAAKNKSSVFLVSTEIHPHIIEVLRTRAHGFGWTLEFVNPKDLAQFKQPYFGALLSYPNTYGFAVDYTDLISKIQAQGGLAIVNTDLLALCLLKSPGELGADIAFGNSQRFGVPMGFGGPHAAFFSTKEVYKRMMPGRIVGVSVDASGERALRLALQTREQHIRREKATSNICTAQVLLANMASFYAVYHGPAGLRRIAERVHTKTKALAEGLKHLGYTLMEAPQKTALSFDTVFVKVDDVELLRMLAEKAHVNFRYTEKSYVGISLDETTQLVDVDHILHIFAKGKAMGFTAKQLLEVAQIPAELQRKSAYLTHAVFNKHHSETQMLRYIQSLANKDVTLAHSMIPLGSCTMKLNATSELMPVSWPEIGKLHPFAPLDQVGGMLEMIHDLEKRLCELTGFAAVSLQPNAGSQGEYAGLMVVRKYFEERGEAQRKICLIPSSAHGTNPASAVMAGFDVVVVQCDKNGNVDIEDLKAKAQKAGAQLGVLMITYPSTHGVFEEAIGEICKIIHDLGGQVYMDGANLNAMVGVCRPGEFGPDVSHMNLHKTFAIPHGGGGPGVGPIGVGAHLKDYLPRHSMVPSSGPTKGISAVSSGPWGSASILPIPLGYIHMMGANGLREATLVSILSANYIAKKLDPHYPVLYKGREGLVAHECILDLRPLKKTSGIDVTDVAKRLMDFGFHAPTMSFPVAGTLMVEPTESESLDEIERFVEAMIQIRKEIKMIEDGMWTLEDNPLVNSPHSVSRLTASEWKHKYSRELAAFPLPWVKANKFWPAVDRIDNAYGDKNLICTCEPISSYEN